MIPLDGTQSAAINASVRGAALLVELSFLSGTQYFTNFGDNVVSGANTYLGVGNLGSIQGVNESDDLAARSLNLNLSIVSTAMLAAAIGPATEYRRRRAAIYLQLMSDTFQAVGTKLLRWQGFMDSISIERDAPSAVKDGNSSGKIVLKCSRAGVPMSRRSIGLRGTDQQQRDRFPGDRGLEYQQALIEKPTVWLTIAFQKQGQ